GESGAAAPVLPRLVPAGPHGGDRGGGLRPGVDGAGDPGAVRRHPPPGRCTAAVGGEVSGARGARGGGAARQGLAAAGGAVARPRAAAGGGGGGAARADCDAARGILAGGVAPDPGAAAPSVHGRAAGPTAAGEADGGAGAPDRGVAGQSGACAGGGADGAG